MNSGLERGTRLFLAALFLGIVFLAFVLPRLATRDRSAETGVPAPESSPGTASVEKQVESPAAPDASDVSTSRAIEDRTPAKPTADTGISGRAVDTEGNAIPGCEVIFFEQGGEPLREFRNQGYREHSEFYAITDASGEYRAKGLVPGEYILVFKAAGYVLTESDSAIGAEAGEMTRAPDQVLERAGVIFGRVVENMTGNPVAGAKLAARPTQPDTPPGHAEGGNETGQDTPIDGAPVTVLSDEIGEFRFDTVRPSRTYDLTVEHEAYLSEKIEAVPPDAGSPVRITMTVGGMIEGIVIDRDSESPVADAEVAVSPRHDEYREVRSAPDGTFLVQGLREGEATVFAEKDGFFAERIPEHTIDVHLGERHFLKMILLPGARIEVTVVDKETGEPIPGAEVKIQRREEPAVTDGEGKGLFTGVNPCCTCIVTAIRAEGYASTGRSAEMSFRTDDRQELRDLWINPKIDDIVRRTVRLERERWIIGTVVDAEDRPIAEAEVRAGGSWHNPEAAPVLTGAEGEFRLGGLGARECGYTVRKEGYAPTEGKVNLVESASEEVRIVLRQGATLEGTVKDGQGRPLEGFSIVLRNLGWGMGPGARSDPEGAWRIVDVPPGTYAVSARNRDEQSPETEIELGRGDHRTIDLMVRPGVTVSGMVADERTGEGIEGVEISLDQVHKYQGGGESSGELRNSRTTTSPSGEFSIDDVPPGNYRLNIRKIPENYLWPDFSHDHRRIEFQVGTSDIANLSVKLKQATTVSGRVSLPTGEPARGARVALLSADPFRSGGGGETDENGAYRFPGIRPAMNYRVSAKLSGFAAAQSDAFSIRQGDNLEGIDLRLQVPGSLSGTIMDRDGNPVSDGYHVSCKFLSGSGMSGLGTDLGSGRPDGTGRYEVRDLPPGEIQVELWGKAPPDSFIDDFDGRAVGNRRTVKQRKTATVSAGEETTGVDFIVSGTESLSGHIGGRVVTSDGSDIPEAKVHAYYTGSPFSSDFGERGETESGPDGRFLIDNLREGIFNLFVHHPEFVYGRVEDVASPSDSLRIVLKRFAGVEGRVIQGDTPVTEYTLSYGGDASGLAEKEIRDPGGVFRIDKIMPGECLMRAYAPGIGQCQETVNLVEGEVNEVVLSLRPETVLRGRVVHGRDLSPAPDAVIEPGTDRETTPGLDGRFMVTGLFPGERTITIRHPDYGSRVFPGISIPQAGETREILFKLKEAGRIEGHVYDRTGTPVEDTLLFLDEYQGEKTFSDYGGFYEFTGVQPGSHLVGWILNPGTGGRQKRTVEVKPGSTAILDFHETGALVSGIVIDRERTEHRHQVSFTREGFERFTSTDSSGGFEISGLEAGTYIVTVKHYYDRDKVIERTVEIPASGEVHLELEYP